MNEKENGVMVDKAVTEDGDYLGLMVIEEDEMKTFSAGDIVFISPACSPDMVSEFQDFYILEKRAITFYRKKGKKQLVRYNLT